MANSESTGKRTPWLVIVLLILLCSAGSAGAVYYFLNGDKLGSLLTTHKSDEPVVKDVKPIFVPIAPFTVNLQGTGNEQRLLYIGLALKVGDAASETLLKEHMPEIRSRLLMLMASQTAAQLATPTGKDVLSAQILRLFEVPLATPQPQLAIQGVFFSDFIVQ